MKRRMENNTSGFFIFCEVPTEGHSQYICDLHNMFDVITTAKAKTAGTKTG